MVLVIQPNKRVLGADMRQPSDDFFYQSVEDLDGLINAGSYTRSRYDNGDRLHPGRVVHSREIETQSNTGNPAFRRLVS